MELQTASILFLIGTLVQSFAPSLPVEYVGRMIFGLGIGTAMHVAPLYIAETSPNALRGKLVSLKEAAIVAGIVLGYGAGALFPGNFRGVWEASIPFEAFMLVGAFLLVPESPRWLALRNRPDEAATALARIQGLNMAEAESQVRFVFHLQLGSYIQKKSLLYLLLYHHIILIQKSNPSKMFSDFVSG